MKCSRYDIMVNHNIALNTYEMVVGGDTTALTKPGQFVNIKIQDCYLRRPLSVCDYSENSMTLVYKAVGRGTRLLSEMNPGEYRLDILSGIGNGFDIDKPFQMPVLVGGGAGCAPMYNLAKKLIKSGKKVTAILGFNSSDEVYYKEEFEKLGVKTIITTVNGSMGMQGFACDAMHSCEYDYFFACGPYPMLKATSEASVTSGQLSFEERMACGFGACMGCSCKTKYGTKRICKDGPVLTKEEVIW